MHEPLEISLAEWQEIIQVPKVRKAWRLKDKTAKDFAAEQYAVKFKVVDAPFWEGEWYVIFGYSLSKHPVMLVRENGKLRFLDRE